MTTTTKIRKIVQAVLAEYGKNNKFSVAATSFPCERFGNHYYAVTIKGWTPDPSADAIKASLRCRCGGIDCDGLGSENVGVLVSFDGPNFVQS